jgi:hypothetical protein
MPKKSPASFEVAGLAMFAAVDGISEAAAHQFATGNELGNLQHSGPKAKKAQRNAKD